jgi:hypothetical protein
LYRRTSSLATQKNIIMWCAQGWMRRIRWRGVVGVAAGRGEQAAGGGEASRSWFSSCRAGLQVGDAAAGEELVAAGGGGPIIMTPGGGPFMNSCDMGSDDDDGKMLAAEGWSANGISGGRDGFHVDDGDDGEGGDVDEADDDEADESDSLFFLLWWWLLLDLERLAGGGVKTTDEAIGDKERCAGAGRMGVTVNGTPSLEGRGRFPAPTITCCCGFVADDVDGAAVGITIGPPPAPPPPKRGSGSGTKGWASGLGIGESGDVAVDDDHNDDEDDDDGGDDDDDDDEVGYGGRENGWKGERGGPSKPGRGDDSGDVTGDDSTDDDDSDGGGRRLMRPPMWGVVRDRTWLGGVA